MKNKNNLSNKKHRERTEKFKNLPLAQRVKKSLKVGMVFENYKHICNELGEKEKSSASKTKQLRDWSGFFDFKREGNKYIILEIYDKPKIKYTERFGYLNELQEMFINVLYQNGEEQMFISKNKLFRLLNLTNDNYAVGRMNLNKLSKLTEIDRENIDEFYRLSRDMFIYNINKVLNGLQDKRLVMWSDSLTLCCVDSNPVQNASNENKLEKIYKGIDEEERIQYEYGVVHNTKYVHRPATDQEEKIVMKIERESLEKLDCTSISEVIRKGKYKEFRELVDPLIWDSLNVVYYYDSYRINPNYGSIVDAFKELESFSTEEEIKLKEYKLNGDTIIKLDENALNRYKKAIKEPNKNEDTQRRSNLNYTIAQSELASILIDLWYQDIGEKIKGVKINRKTEDFKKKDIQK